MSNSLACVYLHIIFSTKCRIPCLDEMVRHELYPYTATVLENLKCHPLRIGGMADHLHILCRLSKALNIPKLIERIKVPTSVWLKTKSPTLHNFRWQSGYAVFSVSQSMLEGVTKYIDHQGEHHKHKTFEDELRQFLKKYNMECDERYIWD